MPQQEVPTTRTGERHGHQASPNTLRQAHARICNVTITHVYMCITYKSSHALRMLVHAPICRAQLARCDIMEQSGASRKRKGYLLDSSLPVPKRTLLRHWKQNRPAVQDDNGSGEFEYPVRNLSVSQTKPKRVAFMKAICSGFSLRWYSIPHMPEVFKHIYVYDSVSQDVTSPWTVALGELPILSHPRNYCPRTEVPTPWWELLLYWNCSPGFFPLAVRQMMVCALNYI